MKIISDTYQMYHEEVDFRTLYWAAQKCREVGITKRFYNVTIDDMAEHGLLDLIIKFPNRKCTPLAVDGAAKNGHLEVIKHLRLKGVKFWTQSFQSAANNGHLDVVKYIYSVSFEDNETALLSSTNAIFLAATNGHYEVVEYLCNIGVGYGNINLAADFAAGNGHFKIVNLLLSFGAKCSSFGLRIAAEKRNLEMVQYLVDNDVLADHWCVNGAIQGGSLEVVKLLISCMIKIDDVFSEKDIHFLEGINVIETAACLGHLDIIKYFLEHGVSFGEGAIDNAAGRGNFEVVRYLYKLEGACTTKAIDHAMINEHYKIVWFLLNQGENCTTDAMDFAAKNGNFKMVRYLYKKGKSYTTAAVDLAARYGHFKIVKWLYQKSCQNGTIWCTHAAIYGAAIEGRLEIVKWLHNHGAPCSPDIVTHVIETGNLEVLKYLHSIGKAFTSEAAEKAARYNHLKVLRWMYDNKLVDMGVLTNSELFGLNEFEIVEWIYEHNGSFTSGSVQALRTYEQFEAADWLEEKLKISVV